MKKKTKSIDKNILVVNPGSTATKYKLFNHLAEVIDERVFVLGEEEQEEYFLQSLLDIEKIAIRVVHGGDLTQTSKINSTIKKKISTYAVFAPIHNARALAVIYKLEGFFKKVPLFAVFDTAFHSSISNVHREYMIPRNLAKKYHLKKYGFHGIALQSVCEKLKEKCILAKKPLPKKIVAIHLGGGCSVTAINNGTSQITSMGMTPLSGIPMITRSGNIDPDIFSVLNRVAGMSVLEVSETLNKESGFYGMTGTRDTKTIIKKAMEGSAREKLALDIFVSEIVQKVFAYTGILQGIDAIVFSGGIGFGNKELRSLVTKQLKILGIDNKNTFVINIDEEFVMFHEIKKLS